MKIPYFQFYPQDYLSDPKCAQLTYEEKGVYIEILCRMWTYQDSSCSLPADDLFLQRILKVRPTKWKKLKSALFEGVAPVLEIKNDRIINKRLFDEHQKVKEKSQKNSDNANKRWGKEGIKSPSEHESEKKEGGYFHNSFASEKKYSDDESFNALINNDTYDANALGPQCHTESESYTDTDTETKTAVPTVQGKVQKLSPDSPPVNKSKYPKCPHSKILGLYHEILPELASVVKLTPARETVIRSRWKDLLENVEKPTEADGLNLFMQYFEKIRGSPWLMGKVESRDPGRKNFQADFDFILRQAKFVGVLEGKYEN